MAVFYGANGAGKTNILEAISLLTPGKGMRAADLVEIRNRAAPFGELWAVSAEVETITGEVARIGTGLSADANRRVVRIDGKDHRGASALSQLVSAIWLTPQMDRLFIEGPAMRRKFFDRLVYAYDPDHAGRLNRYDKNLRERMKLLQGDARPDPLWLTEIEKQLAADAVSVAAARRNLLDRMMPHLSLPAAQGLHFPVPQIEIEGWVEKMTSARPSLDIEEELQKMLAASRGQDAAAGRTHHGVHRSDFVVHHQGKSMPAAESSTGEQKSLLIAITLAHACLMRAEKGYVPLLLLDEVAAHLDMPRRRGLFDFLTSLPGQVFLTGTERDVFGGLENKAAFFHVEDGHAVADTHASAA